jgi:hypothetical protein
MHIKEKIGSFLTSVQEPMIKLSNMAYVASRVIGIAVVMFYLITGLCFGFSSFRALGLNARLIDVLVKVLTGVFIVYLPGKAFQIYKIYQAENEEDIRLTHEMSQNLNERDKFLVQANNWRN